MFNGRPDIGNQLWLQDDSSLSSDSVDSINQMHTKRFRHNQTEQINAAIARMAGNQYPNQSQQVPVASMAPNSAYNAARAEFHQHDETSLVNSTTKDGMETAFHRESKTYHGGKSFPYPTHITSHMTCQMMHHQMHKLINASAIIAFQRRKPKKNLKRETFLIVFLIFLIKLNLILQNRNLSNTFWTMLEKKCLEMTIKHFFLITLIRIMISICKSNVAKTFKTC